MPQREGTAVEDWIEEHRDIIEEIVSLEHVIRFGSIEIVYHDGKPVGLDYHGKKRRVGVDNNADP